METTIRYGREYVPVSEDVASFLQTDDRRQAAQDRSDRRHLCVLIRSARSTAD